MLHKYQINENCTANIPTDTQEKAYYSDAPKPGGTTNRGCGRCMFSAYEMLDDQVIPYNFFRNLTHYMKIMCDNDDITMKILTYAYGYNSFEVLFHKIANIENIAPRLSYDTAHIHCNESEQVDRATRAIYLKV